MELPEPFPSGKRHGHVHGIGGGWLCPDVCQWPPVPPASLLWDRARSSRHGLCVLGESAAKGLPITACAYEQKTCTNFSGGGNT